MAILAKTIAPTGVELNYHRIGEYLETDETITQSGIELSYHRIGEYLETDTQIIFIVYSYPTQDIREEYQPAFKTEVVIEKRDNVTYQLYEMDTNHYNYAYAHLLYMMQNNNFYLKAVGECVNDEPTVIALDEMVVEYYSQDMVEEEQIEDMDIPD